MRCFKIEYKPKPSVCIRAMYIIAPSMNEALYKFMDKHQVTIVSIEDIGEGM